VRLWLALLLALLLLLLRRRRLVRVELLGLAEALALRGGESLVGVLRLDLSLGRVVALVSALVTVALSAVALVALAVVRLVAATAVALVATHSSLVVAAAAAEPTAGARGRLVSSSVDADGAAVEFDIVHGLNGVFGLGVLREAHEAKAAAAASVAVLDHDCFFDIAKLLELGPERHVIRVPGEAANEDFRHDEERRRGRGGKRSTDG